MKRALIVIAIVAGSAACSSSGTTDGGPDGGPCQTEQTPLDYGTCADLIDAGGGIFAQLTITPAERAACETACTSASDQAAVVAAFECLNAIPADAGPCTAATEDTWGNLVISKAVVCEDNLRSDADTACYNAVIPSDAG